MTEKFEIVFIDRTENEYLSALILFNEQRLCEISKEKGNDQLEIEFLTDLYLDKKVRMKFPISDFEETLRIAKDELRQCGGN
jgi:hypothetical protein